MWMGGRVPLGYDLIDRRLVINPDEAERVREIYRLYLELGCVKRLKAQLDKREIKSKVRVNRTGKTSGGASYSRGSLYELLQNPLYVGETRHKKQVFPGEHEAILDRELWSKVGAKLKENAVARRYGTNASAPSLLRGLLYDREGNQFTPSHAVKNGKRYRYYISQKLIKEGASASNNPGRIPAREIEELVLTKLKSFFGSADEIVSALARDEDDVATTRALVEAAQRYAKDLSASSGGTVNEALTATVSRIILSQESVEIQLHEDPLRSRLLEISGESASRGRPAIGKEVIALTISAKLKRCGGAEMRLIIGDNSANARTAKPIPALLKALSRAHEWVRQIEAGKFKDQRAIAAATGLDERYISRVLPNAFLAPEIIEAIVEGPQTRDLMLDGILKAVPLSWVQQKA